MGPLFLARWADLGFRTGWAAWYSEAMDNEQAEPKKTRVLVFSDQTVLADGIEDVLRAEGNLQILRWETDPGLALQSIGQIHPDVVVLAGGHAAEEFASAVIAILKQDSTVKVVDVTLGSGVIHIYGRELRDLGEVTGLLEAIEQSAAFKNEPPAGVTTPVPKKRAEQ